MYCIFFPQGMLFIDVGSLTEWAQGHFAQKIQKSILYEDPQFKTSYSLKYSIRLANLVNIQEID